MQKKKKRKKKKKEKERKRKRKVCFKISCKQNITINNYIDISWNLTMTYHLRYYACHSTKCDTMLVTVPNVKVQQHDTTSNINRYFTSSNKVTQRERERERERERTCWVYEQRHTCCYTVTHPLSLPWRALWISTKLNYPVGLNFLTDNFSNPLIFIYSKIKYIIRLTTSYQIISSYHHDHYTCPKLSLCFYFTSINLMTRYESILFPFAFLSPPTLFWRQVLKPKHPPPPCTRLTFPIWISFPHKDFSWPLNNWRPDQNK